MDWPSLLTGAGSMAAALLAALIPYLKMRGEGRTTLRAEAAEERARRLQAEEELEGARDALDDQEKTVAALQAVADSAQGVATRLETENTNLRAALAARSVLGRLAVGDEPLREVFDASRDLWVLATPEAGGSILVAAGPWSRLGIAKESLLGVGWQSLLAQESKRRADRATALALASGGRVSLWFRGSARGKPAEFCLAFVFGRYNGETLAVARVVAFRPAGD